MEMHDQDNLFDELEKRFIAFANAEDFDKFYIGLTNYFRFIAGNHPLNSIAQSLFLSHKSMLGFDNIKSAYEAIVSDGTLGFHGISPIEQTGLRIFHGFMIDGLKRAGLIKKKTIILYMADEDEMKKNDIIGERRICLVDDNPLCLSFKGKGKETQKFKIIRILFGVEKTGKSAREIALSLDKNGTPIEQDNIKKAIEEINESFQNLSRVKSDLIIITKIGGKNLYFLNRSRFNFAKEKVSA